MTEFRYRAQPLPRITVGSAVVSEMDAARSLTETLKFLGTSCSRNLTVAPVLCRHPGGEIVLSIDFCLCGDDEHDLSVLRRKLPHARWNVDPDADFVSWQKHFDDAFQPPMRGYWKASYFKEPQEIDVNALVDGYRQAPRSHSTILIEHLHGAFHHTNEQASAFPLRPARFGVLIASRWANSGDDESAIRWVRETFTKCGGTGSSAAYSNYTTSDDQRGADSFTGEIMSRLRDVKRRFDPRNLFCRNHNISPRRADVEESQTLTGQS